MSQLHFVQLSDTHIRKDYTAGTLHDMFTDLISPDKKLRQILSELREEKLDFIVISGDLVHEGNEADYQKLKNIIDAIDFQVPILLALGNHDNKKAFCNVFEQNLKNEKYYYSRQIKDWKVVVLDSASNGHGLGEIDKEQIKWLERICRDNEQIIIFMHHPVFWEDALLQIGENRERLIKALSHSNVKAVFCGHVHRNSMKEIENIRQFTVESTACGFDYNIEGIDEQERSGYLKCTLKDDSIEIENCFCGTDNVYKIPNDTLKSVLDKKEQENAEGRQLYIIN